MKAAETVAKALLAEYPKEVNFTLKQLRQLLK
jgi:hypothetical protein